MAEKLKIPKVKELPDYESWITRNGLFKLVGYLESQKSFISVFRTKKTKSTYDQLVDKVKGILEGVSKYEEQKHPFGIMGPQSIQDYYTDSNSDQRVDVDVLKNVLKSVREYTGSVSSENSKEIELGSGGNNKRMLKLMREITAREKDVLKLYKENPTDASYDYSVDSDEYKDNEVQINKMSEYAEKASQEFRKLKIPKIKSISDIIHPMWSRIGILQLIGYLENQLSVWGKIRVMGKKGYYSYDYIIVDIQRILRQILQVDPDYFNHTAVMFEGQQYYVPASSKLYNFIKDSLQIYLGRLENERSGIGSEIAKGSEKKSNEKRRTEISNIIDKMDKGIKELEKAKEAWEKAEKKAKANLEQADQLMDIPNVISKNASLDAFEKIAGMSETMYTVAGAEVHLVTSGSDNKEYGRFLKDTAKKIKELTEKAKNATAEGCKKIMDEIKKLMDKAKEGIKALINRAKELISARKKSKKVDETISNAVPQQ